MGAAVPSSAVQADTGRVSQFWLAFYILLMALASDLPDQHIPEVSFWSATIRDGKPNHDFAVHCDAVPASVISGRRRSPVPGVICCPRLVAAPPPVFKFGILEAVSGTSF